MTPLTVVMYEDRLESLIGLKLAVRSLAIRCPQARVLVTAPDAPASFVAWIDDQKNAELFPVGLRQFGWNVKPALLSAHLRGSARPVVWLDADIIVMGDLAARLALEDPDALVVTQGIWYERRAGTFERTDSWGLPRGKLYPYVSNTALVRAGRRHLPLLDAWQELIDRPEYQAAQTLPWQDRPLHLFGDQDALSALLSSKAWADLPVYALRRGVDIAHCMSSGAYSPAERLVSLRHGRQPTLVHAAGKKPWTSPPPHNGGLQSWLSRVHDDLSPYTLVSGSFCGDFPEELGWANNPRSPSNEVATVVRLGRRQPFLAEFPFSVIDAGQMTARRQAGRIKRFLHRFGKRHR